MRSLVSPLSLVPLLVLANVTSSAAAADVCAKNKVTCDRPRVHVHRANHHRRPVLHSATSGQIGMASYYHHGQVVASGARFNPGSLTAAHKSLPFGTRVRVTHLASGRTVEVRINDRGPFIAGRILDLSKAAANVIGMTASGIARVKMTVLGR